MRVHMLVCRRTWMNFQVCFLFVKQFYSVCSPAPIAYIQLSETCQLNVQHAHVNQYHVEALLTQGKVSW